MTVSLWIIVSVVVLISRRNQSSNIRILLAVAMIIISFFLIMKITILRGVEYKWNGNLFLP
jgi:uncharacterized membrane protein